MCGATLNQFLVQSCLKEAQAVIEREQMLKLSRRDSRQFLNLLDSPPAPNAALRAAQARYKKSRRNADSALTGNHNRQGFDCYRPELNDWLAKIARQHQEKDLSKTFVAVCPTMRQSAFLAITRCR